MGPSTVTNYTYASEPDALFPLRAETLGPVKEKLSSHLHKSREIAEGCTQGGHLSQEERDRIKKIEDLFFEILPFCGKSGCHTYAVAADALLRLNENNPCYYAKRKNLELPYTFKLLVDRRANSIHLIPKKIPDSLFSHGFKYGRKVYSINVETETASDLWSLSSHNSKKNDRALVVALQARAMENMIYERVSNGYPKRLYDYDVKKGDTSKRVALYESYGLNDLLCVDRFLGNKSEHILQRLSILRNTVRALQPYHQKNIAVRDIKLANIVVQEGSSLTCSDWPVAFCDFDFTLDQSVARTEPAPCSGSPECMAPEIYISSLLNMSERAARRDEKQVQCAKKYSQQVPAFDLIHGDFRPADIYALGVSSYMFLTREAVEWIDSDIAGILDSVFQFAKRFDSATIPENTPHREEFITVLEFIIHKMMCIDYTKRPTIDQVVDFFDTLMTSGFVE